VSPAAELLAVVGQTIEPTTASLWLRQPKIPNAPGLVQRMQTICQEDRS
jgi:hypothetical protein